MADYTALAKARRCLECNQPTTGCLSATGRHWPFLCQLCKDLADSYLRAQVHSQAIIHQAIDSIVSRKLFTGSSVGPSPKEKNNVVV